MLVIRTGKDPAHITSGMDRFVAAALEKNLPVEVINHPAGEHGFDRNASDPYAVSTMRRTIDFLRECTQ
jgi:dienelactone hydrolase